MTYKILTLFTVKTKQGDLTLYPGQVITLVEEKAKKLILAGKIQPVSEAEKPQQDRFTQVFDMQACKSKSKYDLNPDRKPCKRCGKVAERFCYDINRTSNSPYCNWFCLRCEPYFPENN